jgi:signal transduction histidine kinase
LQAGTFKLEIGEDVFLPELAANVARRFGPQSSRHQLTVYFDEDFPTIFGDERRLTQVLNNLVSNAIKYSPDGGEVRIKGEVHAEHVTVSVSDEGIGIPPHEQGRIFQKFSRLDTALSRKTEGSGLGLFLSKAIVEAHGGRLWFQNNDDSQAGGPGTTFTFSLPREPVTARVAQAPQIMT